VPGRAGRRGAVDAGCDQEHEAVDRRRVWSILIEIIELAEDARSRSL
jgi:hypothetical protein